MKIAGLGEDRLIAEITRGLRHAADVRVSIGDDCAVIGSARAAIWQLLKTDCVVEGVHFLREADPKKVGWKALARAISDIGAMGGAPKHALITLGLSPETELRRVKSLYAGMHKAAETFGVSIVGGETSRTSGPLFISVALTGAVPRKQCVTRSGGRAGDCLYVTGRLGGSLAGRHLTFTPRVAEAQWLASNFRIRAMMDLSDGLGADLPRLAAASGTGFELARDAVPRNKGCTVEQALSDGEDYELLFAIAPRDAAKLEARWPFPKLPLTRIGTLLRRTKPDSLRGFDHFA